MAREAEIFERNIELSAEFSRYIFEHPEIEERIPKDAEIVLLSEFDDELKDHNLHLGKQIKAEGGRVVYVSIKELRPRALSRIEGVGLEAAI